MEEREREQQEVSEAPRAKLAGLLRYTRRSVRWFVFALLGLYAALVIFRAFVLHDMDTTKAAVAAIHARHVTIDAALGKHLPPHPDLIRAAATIAGIDANHNNIRDDVELSIFKLHPGSARIRAAQLQYAMALQEEFVDAVDVSTFEAAVEEVQRGFFCINDTFPSLDPKVSESIRDDQDKKFYTRIKEVEWLVLNTQARQREREDNFKKYFRSQGNSVSPHCDIDPVQLSN